MTPPRTYASDSSSRKSSHPTTSRTGARDRARLPGVVARPLAEPTRSRYGRLLLRPQPGDAAGDALSGGGVRPVRDGLRSLGASAHRGRHRGLRRRDVARVPGREDDERYLSLAEVLARAEAAGEAVGPDDDHGFGAIQLPFNVAMADAFTRRNQRSPGDDSEPVSTLELAHEAGLSVVTSASIGQGDLAVVEGDPGRHRRNPRGRDPGAARSTSHGARRGHLFARRHERPRSRSRERRRRDVRPSRRVGVRRGVRVVREGK